MRLPKQAHSGRLRHICLLACAWLGIFSSATASFFTLDSSYNSGTYTFSFTDGLQPVSFAAMADARGIVFRVPDATNIIISDDWAVSYVVGGFDLTYVGLLPAYPVGYLPLEISFDSSLTPDDFDLTDPYNGLLSGLVVGTLVLDDTLGTSGHGTGNNSYTSGIVGYASFYFGQPEETDVEILTRNDLLLLGFMPEDLVPVVAKISVNDDLICIALDNIITNVEYHLQYRPSLSEGNWVTIDHFTSNDLDEAGCLFYEKGTPTGFLRVSLPE